MDHAITFTPDEIAGRAAAARAVADKVRSQVNTQAARPVWAYNHVLAYGQSLSNGWEGWPSLSKTQPYDNLMVGDSVHPASEPSGTWATTGTAAFNPLIATVRPPGVSTLDDDATVAAYSPGNAARGETVLEGCLNFWRKQQLALRGLLSDSTRRLIASSCGVGGKSIEELSKGAATELFNRLRGAATAAQTLATAASGTYGVAAVLWLQGENNSLGSSGTTDRATYKALCATLQSDITADIATTIAAQAAPPAIFTYQTSGTYVSDTYVLSIPQAQLECALELDNWYLAAPSYPVTDKGGHLDPNGYRWLGQQFGKVMHRVLDLGQGWRPLHPLHATWRGTQVLVAFHVPYPPLAVAPCYVATKGTTYPDAGFTVTDDDGRIGVLRTEIVAECCVLLTLERAPAGNPFLWYGDKAHHNGNGNLRDSDPAVATDCYEYAPGTGQYPAADIAALAGKPYPLWNWCVVFRMPIAPAPPAAKAARPEAPAAVPDSPAWQILRGAAVAPPEQAPAAPARPPLWQRLFGRDKRE